MELNPSMLEEVDLQAPAEGGGRYQTTVCSVPHWLPDDLWQVVLALLGFSLRPVPRVTEVHFQTDEDNDIFGAACNLWQKLQVFSPCTKAFPGEGTR